MSVQLPSGYVKYKYIESNGTQWIDTGYIPKSDNLKIDIKFNCLRSTSLDMIYGSTMTNLEDDSISSSITIMKMPGIEFFLVYTGSIGESIPILLENNVTYDLETHNNNGIITISLNGESETFTTSDTAQYFVPIEKTLPIYLFTANYPYIESLLGEVVSSVMKLYSFSIYDNDVLVRDLVPCKSPNGVIGLYDTVNDVFYSNSGTGDFTGVEESLPGEIERLQKAKENIVSVLTEKGLTIPTNVMMDELSGFIDLLISSDYEITTGTFTPATTGTTSLTVDTGLGAVPDIYFAWHPKITTLSSTGTYNITLAVYIDGAGGLIYQASNMGRGGSISCSEDGVFTMTLAGTNRYWIVEEYKWIALKAKG